MSKILKKFFKDSRKRVYKQYRDLKFKKLTYNWIKDSLFHGYIYNFTWMGIPIIKYPSDIMVLQEILFDKKPDLIIETGIAHGGSLAFLSSLQKIYNPRGKTVGIEIDFRKHNKENCKTIFKKNKVKVIEGSSIDTKIFKKVKALSAKAKTVLIILDSDHSKNHVYQELLLYSKLVTKNSYIICTDTVIEIMPKGFFLKDWQTNRSKYRNFDKGNSPLNAIHKFLKSNKDFKIDEYYNAKAMITEDHYGFIKKIK